MSLREAGMRISTWTFVALAAGMIASAAAADEPDRLALARQALDVLKANCHRCHGQDGTNEGGFNYVLDAGKLAARKKVVPGDAARSKLYRRLVSADDPMPPEDEKVRPGKDDVALIKKWIEAGAPDPRPQAAKATFVSPADVVAAIRADLETVPERDRRFTRYFTLTHLANAGLSGDELQSYRHGLSKLVNSLSWGRRVVVPRSVDPQRTVFRIDLRDYQWNEKVWEAVLAVNPYGVAPATDAARECAALTQCRPPFVRGDWFVAAASRPPLYHEVLQLPDSEQGLEKQLRVDVAEDIRQERVARAGFNGSGVSRNNRLIERHEAGSVVYWKSYDFATNTGRQNLFAHPLGPGDDDGSFRQDGGEIIFNLPNGLQAYMLVNGAGKRIDKGPTAIVSDPRRPDRAVENGLSCMSCHAKGMIEKGDQVRDHVRKNAGAFTKEDVDTVLALYPPRDTFTDLLRADARRFQEAVARTGAPLTTTEPVAALALRFEAELDLPLAAAEAGVRPDALRKALERSPRLAQELGPLQVEGGTVQRQVFVDAFPDVVRELRLGDLSQPRNRALARWLAQGDDLLAKGDAAGAVKAYAEALALDPESVEAYVGRGDARRALGDFEAAVADYSEALRLDPRSTLALNNRGLALNRRGDHEAAIADFTAALRLDPKLAVAYHNRASAHFARGDAERALADYTEAIRLDPRSARFFNNRGFVHFDRGDDDRAIADYDQAIRIDAKSAVAFNNRGLARSRKGELDRAIADFTEAVRLDPNFAKAYHNRGIAYEKKGDAARAEADRKKALQLDPSLEKE
jgi:tetratricopeptide (TPR) repeat protein/mono/diheme cytochrome c family protein